VSAGGNVARTNPDANAARLRLVLALCPSLDDVRASAPRWRFLVEIRTPKGYERLPSIFATPRRIAIRVTPLLVLAQPPHIRAPICYNPPPSIHVCALPRDLWSFSIVNRAFHDERT